MARPKIKNAEELGTTIARKSALLIAEAGLRAIDTETIVRTLVRRDGADVEVGGERFTRDEAKRIFLVCIGKCAIDAGRVLEGILGDRLTAGIVLDVREGTGFATLRAFAGSHPLPSDRNMKASGEVVALLGGMKKDDLVIFVVSGGGSTLLCLPESGTCEEETEVVHTLMKRGATIQETNTVRKHLSRARGGFLAQYAHPARVISLIFSDVPGDSVEFVASGPTVKDTTTLKDAEAVLAKYDVLRTCGIEKCGLIETPKEDQYFENVHNILALSNETALAAMQKMAKELGFDAEVRTSHLTGEASEVGLRIASYLHEAKQGSALLFGGETTVTSEGRGRGGRNLELALSGLRDLRDNELLMAVASDGRDNGTFGGAIGDETTKKAAEKAGLSIEATLTNHDTYPFFEKVGHYLLMEDTGSNVSDLVVALKI